MYLDIYLMYYIEYDLFYVFTPDYALSIKLSQVLARSLQNARIAKLVFYCIIIILCVCDIFYDISLIIHQVKFNDNVRRNSPGHDLRPDDATVLIDQLNRRPLTVVRDAVPHQHVELVLIILDG